MSAELLQLFFALIIEIILLIIAIIYPDKRRQLVIIMVITAIVGGIVFTPQVIAAINPTPEPTMTATPRSLVNPITHVYDDFNNSANDGSIDRSRWTNIENESNCNISQENGYLVIGHSPSSSEFGSCALSGPFEGVSGSSLRLFEVATLVANDFQGTCCATVQLVLASKGFSDGGGYMVCAINPGPGFISGVFSVTHGKNVNEYRSQLDTTYNDWHTLRFEIDQTNYMVSCYIDDNLIGSVIPKDAANLYGSTFSRYIETGWAKDSSVTFQLDDVKIIP